MYLEPHGIQMQEIPKDPFDELEEWVNGENVVEVREAPRAADGYMVVYDDFGSIFHGKILNQEWISDRAMEIQRQWMTPQFRVRIYLK